MVLGQNIDFSVLNIDLSDLFHVPFFAVHVENLGCFLQFAVLCGEFFLIFLFSCIRTLAWSLICYLGSVLKLLLTFGYYLRETINNYTSLSKFFFFLWNRYRKALPLHSSLMFSSPFP